MKKSILAIMCIFLTISLFGCAGNYTRSIVLVTDEKGIKDNYCNQMTYEALTDASSRYKFNLEVVTPQSDAEYDKAMIEALKLDPVMVVVSSPALETEAVLSARGNPQMYYVFIEAAGDLNLDGQQDSSNIYSVLFAHEQVGFLAGIAAAQAAEANVAFVGEYEFLSYIKYECGFLTAVNVLSPHKTPLVKYISPKSSESDVIKEMASLKSGGVDVIFTIAQNPLIYEQAARLGLKVISTNNCCSNEAKAAMVITKCINSAASIVAEEYDAGTFKGQLKYFSTADGCLKYKIGDKSFLNDEQSEILEKWIDRLSSEELPVAKTREEYKKLNVKAFAANEPGGFAENDSK